MSRRTWLSAVVVAVLAAVFGLASPAPAVAWRGFAICAQGAITAGDRAGLDPARTPLRQTFQLCPGVDGRLALTAKWALAYYADVAWVVGGPRDFPAGGGEGKQQTNGLVDGTLDFGRRGTLRAVCLITGINARFVCARVGLVGADQRVELTPLPVTDPGVTKPADYVDLSDQPDPECAACV